jgi:hypothetical protein
VRDDWEQKFESETDEKKRGERNWRRVSGGRGKGKRRDIEKEEGIVKKCGGDGEMGKSYEEGEEWGEKVEEAEGAD